MVAHLAANGALGAELSPSLWRRARIGLLGGSFNPAHEGHFHISLEALNRLRLDAVWWLVSPQNPLKPERGMRPLAERLAGAQALARHPRILVSDLESRLGTQYTVDTLRALTGRLPESRLVWLMGADNMAGFAAWREWRCIAGLVPVAIFDRPGYSLDALTGVLARRFPDRRVPAAAARTLADREPPAWTFISCPRHPESATRLRQGGGA